jgi:hypothetical protein
MMNMPTSDFVRACSLPELKAQGRLVLHGRHSPILLVYDGGIRLPSARRFRLPTSRSGCYAAANSIWILIGADLVAEAQRPRDETRDKRRLQCSRTGAFRAREGMSVPCAAKFLTNRG